MKHAREEMIVRGRTADVYDARVFEILGENIHDSRPRVVIE